MTVIAFDGRTLAADKQAGDSYVKCGKTTKIRKVRGHLVGCSGESAMAREFLHWFEAGADVATFPQVLREKEPVITVMVITPERKIHTYHNTPFPVEWDNAVHAIGSGREAALAVMTLGYDAEKAVQIASVVCNGCGNGIDTLEL